MIWGGDDLYELGRQKRAAERAAAAEEQQNLVGGSGDVDLLMADAAASGSGSEFPNADASASDAGVRGPWSPWI